MPIVAKSRSMGTRRSDSTRITDAEAGPFHSVTAICRVVFKNAKSLAATILDFGARRKCAEAIF